MGFVRGSNDGKPEKRVAQCSRGCSELYGAVGMTVIADGVGRNFSVMFTSLSHREPWSHVGTVTVAATRPRAAAAWL